MAQSQTLVLDIGSGYIKAGLAGEKEPKVVIPAIVGYQKSTVAMTGTENEVVYYGDEALQKSRSLKIVRPISESGHINNFEEVVQFWLNAYGKVGVDPSDVNVLLTQVERVPKAQLERLAVEAMETFNAPGVYIGSQAKLALQAAGKTTGLVVQVGSGSTVVVPIYEGATLRNAIVRIDLGGRDLDRHMRDLLVKGGNKVDSDAVAESIKKEFTYIVEDFEHALLGYETRDRLVDKKYKLPDGEEVRVGAERFTVPEALFQPSRIEKENTGVHELAYKSIMLCDVDLREQLFNNIVLTGGTANIKGFAERMQKEMSKLASTSMSPKVVVQPSPGIASWLGASTFASLPDFEDKCVTRAEYEEYGPAILHQKML